MVKQISNYNLKCQQQINKKKYVNVSTYFSYFQERYKMDVNSKMVSEKMAGSPGKNGRFFVGTVSVM